MLLKAFTALGLVASSMAISITTPSSSNFWVQFTSNVIQWDFSSGDPNPVDITVTNSNSSILNGAFSIARNLDASNGSFTVTNVTLRVAQGYVVNFVNSTNQTQIFASSGDFEVKKPNTTKPGSESSTASGSSASATSPSGSGSASGSSGSGSATQSSTRGAASSGAAVGKLAGSYIVQSIPAIGLSVVVGLLAGAASL